MSRKPVQTLHFAVAKNTWIYRFPRHWNRNWIIRVLEVLNASAREYFTAVKLEVEYLILESQIGDKINHEAFNIFKLDWLDFIRCGFGIEICSLMSNVFGCEGNDTRL